MNVFNGSDSAQFLHTRLLNSGLETLRQFASSVDEMKKALHSIEIAGDGHTRRRVSRLKKQLGSFEPSVTMIGQIKSGKTSLVNAMVGRPELLPADVNPWTSVVTSLHLFPETPGFSEGASFRFFDEGEWDKLITGGGRIGELASRAGAEDELEKIKQQVAGMREKSRARLGRKFEVMLGQKREYGYFDKDLIERYVCLGDDPEADDGKILDGQGRFADITRSADLKLERAALPVRLCIRDTPGVNDTFMMREQITIRSIRDSRLCVVVLSAHQALSSADLALIRLITHVRSRDVIIFINRIDELSDPARQIPQISESIRNTLKRKKGPEDAQIIFGSALWAIAALQEQLEELPAGSAAALENYSNSLPQLSGNEDLDPKDPVALAWVMSGMPQLQQAISERIVSGVGTELLQRVAASGQNLIAGITAAGAIQAAPGQSNREQVTSPAVARDTFSSLVTLSKEALDAEFDEIIENFSQRMGRVQSNFLERATASLLIHLEKFGGTEPWTYDPAGLRVLLGASHKVLAKNSTAAFNSAVKNATHQVLAIYQSAFGLSSDQISISLPKAPQIPAPVTLGQTIALDLNGRWWKNWWMQRRGFQVYAAEFQELIRSETDPVISELRDDLANRIRLTACHDLETFLSEQETVFTSLERMRAMGSHQLEAYTRKNEGQPGLAAIKSAEEILRKHASHE